MQRAPSQGRACPQCGSHNTKVVHWDYSPEHRRWIEVYPEPGAERREASHSRPHYFWLALTIVFALLLLDYALGYFRGLHLAVSMLLTAILTQLCVSFGPKRKVQRYHEDITCFACGLDLRCA